MSSSLFEQYKAALRRGHMAALAGDLEEALAAYDAATGLVPERALPHASRGTTLHRLDRWPEALEAFDRALQLAPDDEAALRARATARAERGMRSGAAADFERLAFVLDVAGRSPAAAEAARRASELEPSPARAALADRLGAAVAPPDLPPPPPAGGTGTPANVGDPTPADDGGLEAAWAAMAERATVSVPPGEPAEPERHVELGAGDALDALRAGMEAEERAAAEPAASADAAEPADAQPVEPGDVQHVPGAAMDGGEPAGDAMGASATDPGDDAGDGTQQVWPGIDLPSPPPPPIEGPPPDPEALLAEAALVLESGEVEAARDLMLTAARVHREAERIDAALEICLNLLSIAPGDPRVHLAIANLQLDRGWTPVATEKLDLLVRLTSLTGDTQAEADVHGLASERLRDEPAAAAARR